MAKVLRSREGREIKGKDGNLPFNSGASEHIILLTNTEELRFFNRD